MTRALYAFAQWSLDVLPVDVAGRRVFDETLADWRKESANVKGRAASALVTARAMWSVLRCVVSVSAREVRSTSGIVLLRRLTAWSVASVLLYIAFNWNQSIPYEGTRLRIGPTAAGLLSVSWILGLMPLLAFACAALGRRQATAPRLGPALVLGAVTFVLAGWVVPVTNQAYREFMFGLWSGGTIEPGLNEHSTAALFGLLFTNQLSRAAAVLNNRMLFVVAIPVLLTLGVTARALAGRRRVAASVLPLAVFAIPFIAQIDPNYGFISGWPALVAAVVVSRAISRGSVSRGATA